MAEQRKWNFNDRKPQQFKDRKEEIISKLNGQIKRREALAALALQIKGIIQANDGKCYNVKFDRQIEEAADQANAKGMTGNGWITTSVKGKRSYGNNHYYLEIELRNHENRYRYTEYESYWLNVEVTDYTRGRIQAGTLEDLSVNASNTNEIKNAIAQFDETAEIYARLCQAADDMNETSYLLRAFMEKVYISGVAQ